MARKQSSTPWYQGNPHHEIFFDGHYHDKMYKGSELVWEKLGERGLEPLKEPKFITVDNFKDNYWALVVAVSPTEQGYNNYGVAKLYGDRWIMVTELKTYGYAYYTLYATGKGCVISEFYGGNSFSSSYFRGHYFVEDNRIKDYHVDLIPLEEITEGTDVFLTSDESINLRPSLRYPASVNVRVSDITGVDGYCYLMKDAIFYAENVRGTTKILMYKWDGTPITSEGDPSEYISVNTTTKYRDVTIADGIPPKLAYRLPEAKTELVSDEFLALMVGAKKFNVGVNCTKINIYTKYGRFSYGQRSLTNSSSWQQTHSTSLTMNDNIRLFVMSAAWNEASDVEGYYVRRYNIGIYPMGSGRYTALTIDDERLIAGEFNPNPSTYPTPYDFAVYGLYLSPSGYMYLLAEIVGTDASRTAKLYVGRYNDEMESYVMHDTEEVFRYPYSFGGIVPVVNGAGDIIDDDILINKTSNNYNFDSKKIYDISGYVKNTPIYWNYGKET